MSLDAINEFDEPVDETDDSDELFEHYRFVADSGQNLLRIDKFLVNRITNVSRNKIQEAAEAGCILANETPVKSNYRVKPNDVISVVMSYPDRKSVV